MPVFFLDGPGAQPFFSCVAMTDTMANNNMGVWGAGSVAKSIGCTFRGPGFSSQNLQISLEVQFQAIQWHLHVSVGTRHTCGVQAYIQAKDTYK